MSGKLTPWFPGDVNPVREGVYQRLFDEDTEDEAVVFSRFDGVDWFTWADSPDRALVRIAKSPFKHGVKWRGLAEEAK